MKNIFLLFFLYNGMNYYAQKTVNDNLVIENIPEIRQELIDQMTQYQNTRSAVLFDYHPRTSQMLISTRFGETPQLHLLSQPLGARKQITFFKEPVAFGTFCPDTTYNGLLYNKDVGGNEFSQIYWYDLSTGKHSLLTDGR